MRLWVVGHGADRQWLKVSVTAAGETKPRDAFIFGEWRAGPVFRELEYTVPCEPREGPWSNTDPLVIGPYMYYSYCKKGFKSKGTNLRGPNTLEAGDLILFGGHQKGRVVIDTIFAIGAYREWPEGDGLIPNWAPELVASRVHFHSKAQKQHPEVHSRRPVASRSYQSLRHSESHEYYAWVPAFQHPGRPFSIGPEDKAYQSWFSHYDKPALSLFQGSFPVVEDLSATTIGDLFRNLVEAARSQGCDIGVNVKFVGSGELVKPVMQNPRQIDECSSA